MNPSNGQGKQKSYRQILAEEIESGLHEHQRSSHGLLLSGFSAGLDVSFSLFLMAVAMTLSHNRLADPVVQLLMGGFYSVGFIFVVIGRSELFTEHTTLAVLPVLNRRTTVPSLLRLWVLVYAGNVAGAALFAYFAVLVGPALGTAEPWAFGIIAHELVKHGGATLTASAVLAGWLMGLMSWLVMAARDTIGRIVIIWIIAFAIGFAKLPHAILGTTEVLSGVFAGTGADLPAFGRFLGYTTLGNALGGVIFVALIKYSHSIRSEPD
jgi:formate/nitrite transporter FocA (FNT family)